VQEMQAHMAVEGHLGSPGPPAAEPYPALRLCGRVAQEGAYTPTPGKLGSFGMETERTPYGVTTNAPTCGSHWRDARATEEPAELGSFGREGSGAKCEVSSGERQVPRRSGTPLAGQDVSYAIVWNGFE
jgi:hypothetical protein